jgi:uroporphyrinogen decarboxylase
MALGPKAIDAELLRVAPLLEEGGFIPWCDHHVPPDVSLENYQYYVRRMKEASLDPGRFLASLG